MVFGALAEGLRGAGDHAEQRTTTAKATMTTRNLKEPTAGAASAMVPYYEYSYIVSYTWNMLSA